MDEEISDNQADCVMDNSIVKRKRKHISLETKLEVLDRYDRGERTADIERHFGLNESTLRTIRFNADKIRRSCTTVASPSTLRDTVTSSLLMEKMENCLVDWLKKQKERSICVSTSAIRNMAMRLYKDLKKSDIDCSDLNGENFTASSVWLEKFKAKHEFQKLKSTNKDSSTVDSISDVLTTLIEENNYSSKQVFSISDSNLYWRRVPRNCYIFDDEKPFSQDKDRVTIVFGINATGDFKLKPLVIYHEENPKVLKGYSKMHLPVVWRSSRKGLLTSSVFVDYFSSHLHQELQTYCQTEGIPFKILLILDTASGYPQNLTDLSSNIKVLYLPPMSMSVLQPVAESVTTIFQCLYHKQVLSRLINEADIGGMPSVIKYFHDFNIKIAVDIIGEAWAEVSERCLNEGWVNLWPEIVTTSSLFSSSDYIYNMQLTLVDMFNNLSFHNIDISNIIDLVNSHKEEISGEDLIKLETERDIQASEDESSSDTETVRTLSTDILSEIFHLRDTIISLIDENDPDRERSSQTTRDINNSLASYIQLYKSKMKLEAGKSADGITIKYEVIEET